MGSKTTSGSLGFSSEAGWAVVVGGIGGVDCWDSSSLLSEYSSNMARGEKYAIGYRLTGAVHREEKCDEAACVDAVMSFVIDYI